MTRKILTRDDAAKFSEKYKTQAKEAAELPSVQLFKPVKPPFKCSGCKRKFKTTHGYKLQELKMCPICVLNALEHGYAEAMRAEALTGQKIMSAEVREAIENIRQAVAQQVGTQAGITFPPTNTN